MKESESIQQIKKELRKEIVEEVLHIIRDEIEENFTDDFIRRVKEAEARVSEGKVTEYTADELRKKLQYNRR